MLNPLGNGFPRLGRLFAVRCRQSGRKKLPSVTRSKKKKKIKESLDKRWTSRKNHETLVSTNNEHGRLAYSLHEW